MSVQLKINIDQVTAANYNDIILKNFYLTVEEPGIVWIQGENGTGKSVLSSIISGKAFFKGSGLNVEGKVVFTDSKGNSYIADKENGAKEYAEQVSFLPQKVGTSLLAIHHQDDICFPLEGGFPQLSGNTLKEKDKTAISRINNLLNELNLWIHTTKKLGQCSYGETRRMEYGCVLSFQSSLVILDEPFSGLDLKYQKTIISTLETFLDNKSIWIIASHVLPEKYGIKPIEHVILEPDPMRADNFKTISKFTQKYFLSNKKNVESDIKVNDFMIARKTFNTPSIEINNFNAEVGEITWLEGDNGSGKSTFLQFLAGLLDNSKFRKISVYGNVEGGPYDIWTLKAPNSKVRLSLQDPFRSFVHADAKDDLYHINSIEDTERASDPSFDSFLHELSKNWGSFERKPSTFSFGQLKFLQLLLIPFSVEVVIIDEPLLGLHTSLYDIMLSTLSSIAESGRIVIASCESNIVDVSKYLNNYHIFKLPSAN